MKTFIIGTVFGILIVTVGFSGIARIFDNGVTKVQSMAKEASQ
jgi:hypothetical protein